MSDPKPLILPPQRSALAGIAPCTDEWYVFFRLVVQRLRETGVDPSVIADIEARLAALEASGGADFLLQGPLSVEVVGSPAGGLVQLSLVADEASPASTHYYGTGPTGTKGFFQLSDAVEGDDSIIKTVGVDGVSTFNLDGDAATPGPGFYYGTDGSGVKGWYPNPSGMSHPQVMARLNIGL